MSRYVFTICWQQYDSRRMLRDYANQRYFSDSDDDDGYSKAVSEHNRAKQGRWIDDMHVNPHVTALFVVEDGRQRELRPKQDWCPDCGKPELVDHRCDRMADVV